MKHRGDSKSHERQGRYDSPWRLFYSNYVQRRRPSLESDYVDSYHLFSKEVGVSIDRLRQPADDSYTLSRGQYSSRLMLFGERAGVDESRLSALDVQACVDFYEEASQFFGDRFAFEAMRDVVFLPAAEADGKADELAVDWRGFTVPDIPSTVFINSRKIAGCDEVKEVLRHEFSHLIEDLDLSDANELLEVSGWNVEGLDRAYDHWRQLGHDVDEKFYNGNLNISSYAKIRPRETIADMYAGYMEGEEFFSDQKLARDAMISYLMKRSGKPLASSIKRRPIKVKRR